MYGEATSNGLADARIYQLTLPNCHDSSIVENICHSSSKVWRTRQFQATWRYKTFKVSVIGEPWEIDFKTNRKRSVDELPSSCYQDGCLILNPSSCLPTKPTLQGMVIVTVSAATFGATTIQTPWLQRQFSVNAWAGIVANNLVGSNQFSSRLDCNIHIFFSKCVKWFVERWSSGHS